MRRDGVPGRDEVPFIPRALDRAEVPFIPLLA
jgi:hypothetical protein